LQLLLAYIAILRIRLRFVNCFNKRKKKKCAVCMRRLTGGGSGWRQFNLSG